MGEGVAPPAAPPLFTAISTSSSHFHSQDCGLVESKFIVIVSFRVLQRNRINRIDISVSICHLSLSIDLLWALVHAVLEAKQSHSLPLQAEEPRKASSIRSPSLGA